MTKQKYNPILALFLYRQSSIGKLANLQSEEYFLNTSVKDRSGVNNLYRRENFSTKFDKQIIDESESTFDRLSDHLTAYYHEKILSL
jgi:hypothetical protein